jgi:hypothetical protein
MERAAGIEPATLAWKARALPLCNARAPAQDSQPLVRALPRTRTQGARNAADYGLLAGAIDATGDALGAAGEDTLAAGRAEPSFSTVVALIGTNGNRIFRTIPKIASR